nr:MAG TPA_asm: hypothetical protein [Bacteriophage sp.]
MTQIRIVKIINKIERLRRAIRREGTPAIQSLWDDLEPHVSIFLNAEAANGLGGAHVPHKRGPSDLG